MSGFRCSNPSIERMVFIASLLRIGKPFNVPYVADRMETSRKTINRDIEFMRDRLGYEITFNHSTKTFEGKEPKERVL